MQKIVQKLKRHINLANKAESCAIGGSIAVFVVAEAKARSKTLPGQYWTYSLERNVRWWRTASDIPDSLGEPAFAVTGFSFQLELRNATEIKVSKTSLLNLGGHRRRGREELQRFYINTTHFPPEEKAELDALFQTLWEKGAVKALTSTLKEVA